MRDGFTLPPLSPADAVATLRSLPRRFQAIVAPPAPDDPLSATPDDPDAEGWRPTQRLARVAALLAQAAPSLDQVLVRDDPALDPGALTPEPTAAPGGSGTADVTASHVPSLLDELTAAATRLADLASGVPAEAWARPAHVGDTAVQAIDLLRHAVAGAIVHLRALERC